MSNGNTHKDPDRPWVAVMSNDNTHKDPDRPWVPVMTNGNTHKDSDRPWVPVMSSDEWDECDSWLQSKIRLHHHSEYAKHHFTTKECNSVTYVPSITVILLLQICSHFKHLLNVHFTLLLIKTTLADSTINGNNKVALKMTLLIARIDLKK